MSYSIPTSRDITVKNNTSGGNLNVQSATDSHTAAGAMPFPAKSAPSTRRSPRNMRSTASLRSNQDKHRRRTRHRSNGQASRDKQEPEQHPRSSRAPNGNPSRDGDGRSGSYMRPKRRATEVNTLRGGQEEDSSDTDGIGNGTENGMSGIEDGRSKSRMCRRERSSHHHKNESPRSTGVSPREHRLKTHRDKGIEFRRPASAKGTVKERQPLPPRRSHSYNTPLRPNPILSPLAFVRSFSSNTTNLRPERPPLERSSTAHSIHRSKSCRPRAEECSRETLPQLSTETKTRELRKSRVRNMLPGLFAEPTQAQKAAQRPTKVQCLTCMDDVPRSKAAKLKCSHRMCHPCLKRIFKLSVTDPQHMPPKCCTSECIPLAHVDKLFHTKFKKTWNIKFEEYSTKNRIYCPKRRCGEWIMPDDIKKVVERGRRLKKGKCRKCKTEVCGKCSGKWHGGGSCPKDDETTRLLATAREKGWQRCYSCRTMVELKEGCNHMTCRCTAEFCMLCGNRWKTCDCPWFNFQAVEDDQLNHMRVPGEINPPNQLNPFLEAGFAAQRRRLQQQAQAQGPVDVLQDNLGRLQDFVRQEQANPQLRQRERQRRELTAQRQQVTYAEEMESRQRQERDDAEIALRMQNVDVADEAVLISTRNAPWNPFTNPLVGRFGRNLWAGNHGVASGRPAAEDRRTEGAFEEDFAIEERASVLAGLAGRERGSGRIDTWMEHVPAELAV